MRRFALLSILLCAAAGYVYLQTTAPSPKLASFMPSGALLYLESANFGGLLRDWDDSKVKAEWLESDNYEVFSRSNLFTKLNEVYGQYAEAAGFLPDVKSIIEIAGSDSALALYGIRDVEFLYISRIADASLFKSQLWALRDKFEQRQAGGVSFYLHTDAASKRTVAFAFTKGYLLLATRDDLVAQSLELLAGGANPAISSDRWYRDSVAQAATPGELRLVMNLESIVKSEYFRSYWVQRNGPVVRQYFAGVADVKRSAGSISETRVLLHTAETAPAARPAALTGLLPLVPAEAGLYKASAVTDASSTATLIVNKLIGSPPAPRRDDRDAPYAVSLDNRAGSEADLETRIDEQPLPADAGLSNSVAAVRGLLDQSHAEAVLLVQSSSPAAGTFVQTPSVIVLKAPADWDRNAVRSAFSTAAGKLWTTSQVGAAWTAGTAGRHAVERLDGLGAMLYATRGPLLFVSNDARLLAAVLDRAGAPTPASPLTYAAGFRHGRERANYLRMMKALDFTAAGGAPSFFSGNIASLSAVLSGIGEVRVTEQENGPATVQTVLYQMAP